MKAKLKPTTTPQGKQTDNKIKLSSIKANPKNPRIIRDEKFRKLCKSIEQFPKMMELRPIIIDESNTVLGGNMRLRALQDLGMTEVPESWIKKESELTEEQKREFIIKDNVGFGEWDWDILANEWDEKELDEWGLDIDFKKEDVVDDDFEINDNIDTDITDGDLIEIGTHRLMCGDSSNKNIVDRVLNGKEPYLMITDPPYGVDYDPNWRNHAAIYSEKMGNRKIGDGAIKKVNNDDRTDWTSVFILSPSKVCYVYHAGKYSGIVQKNLEDCDFLIRAQIIWNKGHFAISRGDYHWAHEPCWYAVKKGSKGNWAGDRKQTTIWDIKKNKSNDTGHSTQKPVECMAKAIANHDGDVYDPFLGSGTTMVAAHQLGRKCYGVEIDPKFCQIIIDRMLKLDDKIIVKINGKPYKK